MNASGVMDLKTTRVRYGIVAMLFLVWAGSGRLALDRALQPRFSTTSPT